MRSIGIAVALLVGTWTMVVCLAAADDVVLLDDCKPNADWPSCLLEEGDVTQAEIPVERESPNPLAVIGHQAWRNDPWYLKIELGDTVKVKNKQGRNHTFTEVVKFGGGRVEALNFGLTPLTECGAAVALVLLPGASTAVSGLSVGNHHFQCCLHPWMRMVIKVFEDD